MSEIRRVWQPRLLFAAAYLFVIAVVVFAHGPRHEPLLNLWPAAPAVAVSSR